MFVHHVKYGQYIRKFVTWLCCRTSAFGNLVEVSILILKHGDGQLRGYFSDFGFVVHGAAPFKIVVWELQFNGRMPRHQINRETS